MPVEIFCSTITDRLNTGVLILDVNFNIVKLNRFLEIHANIDPEDVIGKCVFNTFSEIPKHWFKRKVASVVQLNSPSFCSWEQRHHLLKLPHTRPITTDSRFMAQNVTFLPIETKNVIDHICVLIEDVTDVCHYQSMLKKTLNELALASRIDGLTQIFNRKHWEACLEQEFSRARRYGHAVTLILFDLDHFKLLNDTYGHQCGDLVLIEVAKYTQSLLRRCDIFGRYGGEEFAIILPETDLVGAADVAERIRQGISELFLSYQGNTITTSASMGLSEVGAGDKRYEDLIRNADVSLYQAKALGRNCICGA